MDPTTTEEALGSLKALKDSAVRREGVGTNLPIMVVLMREGVDQIAFQLHSVADRQYTRPLTTAIALTDCDAVVLGSDSFILTDADECESLLASGEPANLPQRFADGDPNVGEAIVVTTIAATGETASALAPYAYAGRTVVWMETEHQHETVEVAGDLAQAVELGFGLQARRTGGPATPRELAERLGLLVQVPTLQAPPRNSRCRCGSGKKAKHCCWSNNNNTEKVGHR